MGDPTEELALRQVRVRVRVRVSPSLTLSLTLTLALRQLPLKRMDVALVFAGVDLTHHGPLRSHGGTELQIQDSEAITSTLLLREMHAQAHAAALRSGKPGCPPLTIVTQVVDVLTQRLFEMEPGLLEPKTAYPAHGPGADDEAHRRQVRPYP